MKVFIKSLIPPIFFKISRREKYGFFGNFSNWSEAEKQASGFNSDIILEKVKEASLKVKRGEAAFERDSVTFNKKEYAWHLLAPLLWLASKNGNALNVIDFGGSLGSTYFQNLDFLKDLQNLSWNIVEQKNFVEVGKKLFETKQLRFYNSMNSMGKPDAVLFGSSLQYLDNPYLILEETAMLKPEIIIVERTPFHNLKDTITIQKVPPKIYDASYPAWIFDLKKMIEFFDESNYSLFAEQKEAEMPRDKSQKVDLKGLLFKKND